MVGTSPVAGAGTAPGLTADAPPDPLLAQIGVALFWITVGWWVAVIVRLLGSLVREGLVSTLFIESLGRWPEEAVVAAVISVLAALVLLLGRGSRGRDLLGWASAVLAVDHGGGRDLAPAAVSRRLRRLRRRPPLPSVLRPSDADAVAGAYGLGHPARLEGPVARGQLGQVWRLDTERGAVCRQGVVRRA